MIRHLTRVAGVLAALASASSFGFPEMVRHGYVNCTSCHFSPNGGGIINGYGRVQSEEVLSIRAWEGEGGLLHGLLPSTVGPVSFGGQFRALQLWEDSAAASMGKTILMQSDVEAAAIVGPIQVVATAGVQDVKGNPFLSRRHYVLFRPNEASPWAIRAGRFIPAFGINVPDHAIATKSGLGIGQGSESYNIEGSWLGEQFDVFLTANLGRPGEDREKGFTARGSYNLGEKSKLGVSYYYGATSLVSRQLFGAYGIIGFSEHFFLLAEFDFQNAVAPTGTSFGPASYARLDYEVIRGAHLYLSGEYARANATAPVHYAAGIGTQLFPRPHFEFRAQYDKRLDDYTGELLADYGWLMFHYYL